MLTYNELSSNTKAALDICNNAQARKVSSEKAQAKACLQRAVAQDISNGLYSREAGEFLLKSRDALGRKGRAAIAQV